MKQQLYTIKDEITGWNAPIIIQSNDQEATRTFTEEANNKDSMINRYPKDYSIWWIGERDTVDGWLTETEPRLIMRAESIVRKEAKKNDELEHNASSSR